jgi:Fic family protein
MADLRKDELAPGYELPIEWNGRGVVAWVPAFLAARDLRLTEATVRLTERAAAAARRGSDALPADWEALARLLLRAEGVASSYVEGVRAPVAEVAAAELDPTVGETAAWVADNLAAVLQAVAEARQGPLEIESMHRWHRRLMTGQSHLSDHLIGASRDLQGWIGGSSPLDAALVVPPPDLIAPLLGDLVEYANRSDIDPVTQAAVAHAQFELIHPYADGNGRVGRILIGWILTRRLDLVSPPPISVQVVRDIGGYLSGLTLFRLGQTDVWVAWFAQALAGAGETTSDLIRDVGELRALWALRLANMRTDAVARRVPDLLPAHPVLDATTLAHELGVSERSARGALNALHEHGILERLTPAPQSRGRPRGWWVAPELLSLLST